MSNEYNHEDTSKVTLWTIMPKRVYESTILKMAIMFVMNFNVNALIPKTTKSIRYLKTLMTLWQST